MSAWDTLNLYYARHWERKTIPVREFLAADVEYIESVSAVRAMFEWVFFGLRKFYSDLFF